MSDSGAILVTGGAGFIGCHVVKRLVENYPSKQIVNLDVLTYAGNLENLTEVEEASNYTFVKGDIIDSEMLDQLFAKYDFEGVIHLAAESHVDRSIEDPLAFIQTNIVGTMTLLNAAKKQWGSDFSNRRFYHISTDEVYGSLSDEGFFYEDTAYDPRSPYSASKASSDHLVRAFHHTYGMPIVISNCSNNYGANQFPEKLIPLVINNIRHNKPLPIYGKGDNVRDWLWVEDHARAIEVIYNTGVIGETYNIGGNNEWQNIDLVRTLCKIMDKKLGREEGTSEELIEFVKDRAGHDLRYAIDATKIKNDLGWEPSITFEVGMEKTIDWYLENQQWLDNVTSGNYKDYYDRQYVAR